MSRTFRHACALALGGLLLTLMPALAPAQAISTGYLCSGYQGCKKAGYGNAGYAANNHKMYWRMYTGHNCTNYVAYRLVKAGMPNVRPWSGSGNATNWGRAMAHITDQQPRVGAVAWWKANVPGAGSSGHVAYVEKVISPTEIVISEDSWGGTFHWRRLVKGTGWPSGFIHFIDRTIDNVKAPTVTGTPQVDVPLTATPGTWKPKKAKISYQWLVKNDPIPGATKARYTPTAEVRGRPLSVKVTAKHNKFSPTTLTVKVPGKVAPGQLENVEAPVVTGDPFVDETLTATPGAWSPAPDTSEIRWRADNVTIEGATGPTLTLTEDLVGKRISAVSVAWRDGYKKAVRKSTATARVVLGRIEVEEPFRAKGRNRVGHRMWIRPGAFTPPDATVTYTWLRDGEVVPDATGPSYEVTAADAGARMTAVVTLSKPRFQKRVIRFVLGGPVTTKPSLRVVTRGKRRKAIVVVDVTAPGVTHAGGRVTARIGKKKVTAGPRHGRVRIRLDGLRPARHKVWISYAGTTVVEPARTSAHVRVRR